MRKLVFVIVILKITVYLQLLTWCNKLLVKTKMNTLIIVIMDESGSMDSKKMDVIGGFNSFVEDQKRIKNDKALLYLVKFNSEVKTVHKGLPLENLPTFTFEDYSPEGLTALYDAIYEGVRLAEKDKKPEDRVICVIMTDGEENSSREITKKQIKDIISGHESQGDWTFLYIGENPVKWAEDSGMCTDNSVSFDHNDASQNFAKASLGVSNLRRSGSDTKQRKDLLSSK